ncbi:hypothetical protein WMY93_008064 [Mugilogobius chulae]|uniref:Uncharacterized protein n=1 Tax=Mugilogobius chulae TaxID=88201 RepID=A0AAW0PTI3_9GOBI
MSSANKEHGYSRSGALQQACEEDNIVWMDQQAQVEEDALDVLLDGSSDVQQCTSVKSPHPKKLKNSSKSLGEEISNTTLYDAILELTRKLDSQGKQLHMMDRRFQENTDAVLKVMGSVEANTTAVKHGSERNVSGARKIQAKMVLKA